MKAAERDTYAKLQQLIFICFGYVGNLKKKKTHTHRERDINAAEISDI